ncbi:MAG: hypothetical protein H0W00_03515 [Chloroflexi bacterium]|nr:hypothetical protein [Chloroflexota bacterium]
MLSQLSYRPTAANPTPSDGQQMTTWPFRDTVTFGRAFLIARDRARR